MHAMTTHTTAAPIPGAESSSGDNAHDLTLMARLRAGDTAALDELMQRYSGRVYRLARGITRNDADAEEVVQDVFVTLLRKHQSFEGRSALGSWIYRITTNTALNKRRGKRFEAEVHLEDCLPAFKADGHREGDPSYLVADWSQSPERELLSAEARQIIAATMDALPDHYRAVLGLRDIEGLSNEEVAGILGESIPSVKSKLHRARMALRERLTHHFGAVREP
jgi:RNA polymerase sigma-70 factor (ECF subfamily)